MSLFRKKTKVKQEKRLEAAGNLLIVANKYLYWMLSVFVIILMAVAYLFLLAPKFTVLQDKSENFLPSRRQILADLNKLEVKLQYLDDKFQTVKQQRQNDLQRISRFLPDKPDYPSLFVQAEYLANLNNLKLQSIDISLNLDRPLSQRNQPTRQQAGLPTEQALEILPENVRSLLINVRLGEGTYEDFKTYLDDLEKNLRLYDVQSLSFGSIGPETDLIDGFNLALKTYYQIQIDEQE